MTTTPPKRATPLMRAIVEVRYAYRMSQREFAERLKVPRSRIAAIEAGWFRTPGDIHLVPFAQAAGVTVDELREGKVAVNRCGCCGGDGVEPTEKRTLKRLRTIASRAKGTHGGDAEVAR